MCFDEMYYEGQTKEAAAKLPDTNLEIQPKPQVNPKPQPRLEVTSV